MDFIADKDYIQQLQVDCVIFGFEDKKLKVLLPKLRYVGGFYGLPSGFVHQEEDLEEAAYRILCKRTGIEDIYLEQFYVFGKKVRKNKEFLDRLISLNPELQVQSATFSTEYAWFTKRFVSIGYYALVDIHKVVPQKSDLDESVEWYDIQSLPDLIMDHRDIVNKALLTLRRDLNEKINGFNLLPPTFTMREVQRLYEAVFDQSFVRSNFQQKMLSLGVLERLGKKYTGASNKAPYLYRFKQHNPEFH